MNLIFLTLAFKGSYFAATEVIVMRADQDVFAPCSRNDPKDISIHLPDLLHSCGYIKTNLIDGKAALSMRVFVIEIGLELSQVLVNCGDRKSTRLNSSHVS